MISVDDILPSSTTVSNHIYGLANRYRATLSEQLKDAYAHGSLTICPDMWSDRHNKVAYLGVSATYVDQEYRFHSIDLFCQAYQEDDKKSENILLVRMPPEPMNVAHIYQSTLVFPRQLSKAFKNSVFQIYQS